MNEMTISVSTSVGAKSYVWVHDVDPKDISVKYRPEGEDIVYLELGDTSIRIWGISPLDIKDAIERWEDNASDG